MSPCSVNHAALLVVTFVSVAKGLIKYNSVLLSKPEHYYFEEELTAKGIIPEVVPRAPFRIVYLEYLNKNHSVLPGAKFMVGRPDGPVAKEPYNVTWGANATDMYTLCLFDFDAPVRAAPVLRSYIHWLVGNIPGAGVKNGETFFEYFPLRARADTGTHRYVMLIWRHSNIVEFKEPYRNGTDEDDRVDFSINEFEKKYQLEPPIALTYFECEYDHTIKNPHLRYDDEEVKRKNEELRKNAKPYDDLTEWVG
ncbi:phosphatidylethanolamine-binding protein 1-like [Bemisia tabaci]|uniref:phosphatidylethanolamine-binding protein 1-like n=1 Tax=Bemisia tabaci TaxID=7038 RepID=UPI003B28B510